MKKLLLGAHLSIAKGLGNVHKQMYDINADCCAIFLKNQRRYESKPYNPVDVEKYKHNHKEFILNRYVSSDNKEKCGNGDMGNSDNDDRGNNSISNKDNNTTHTNNININNKYTVIDNIILPHGSYLINMASSDDSIRKKSYECLLDDMNRCKELNIKYYNLHPGSDTQKNGIRAYELVADMINKVLKETDDNINSNVNSDKSNDNNNTYIDNTNNTYKDNKPVILIENMAGQGNVLGNTFEGIKRIIDLVEDKSRIGVCLDTCHLYGAGYNISNKNTIYDGNRNCNRNRNDDDNKNITDNTDTITDKRNKYYGNFGRILDKFNNIIGIEYLKGMHINDSKEECNSRKDRHESIGKGKIGIETFRELVNDSRCRGIPLVLETPDNSKYKEEVEMLRNMAEW
ncbi:apurinic/apyrimidinic endonuclease Apn1 [Spraguea lophii 42_110]|uniref:Apurinic/apyrimidinic endonuclease Apn1 n=1 Tax=Spraguea lophii (strain 42_110) TaxID=1358809 RepID=S7W7T2_SPRLO|nr:apurinic/apyrimidinic endonuclease Apn1 [Spraguea lophii 42_110]